MSAVQAWIQSLDDDPLLVSVSDPSVKKAGLFASKKTMYVVRASSRAALLATTREYKDFVQLHKTLVAKFRGACVPPVPPEKHLGATGEEFVTKRMHLLEFFLQTIAENPFMRTAWEFDLFITSQDPYEKALKAAASNPPTSPTDAYWSKALEEVPEMASAEAEKTLNAVSKELDAIVKSLTQIKDAAKQQVAALKKVAEASALVAHAVESWQVREEAHVSNLRGVLARPDGTKIVLPLQLKTLVRSTRDYAGIVALEYGPSQLETILVDSMRFEISQAERWKLQVLECLAKIKAKYRAAEQTKQLGMLNPKTSGDATKHEARVKEFQRVEAAAAVEEQDYVRGLLGVEMSRYRKQRTIRVENMMALMARMHVRGANLNRGAWDGSSSLATGESASHSPRGSGLGDKATTPTLATAASSAGSFFRRKSLQRTASGHLKVKNAGEASEALAAELQTEASTKAPARTTALDADENKVVLKAVKAYEAKKKDELDLTEGELVTAVRIDDDLWIATNAAGKSGLVPSSHVAVPTKPATSPTTAAPRASVLPAPPPGLEESQMPPPPPPSRDPALPLFDFSGPGSRLSVAPRKPEIPDFLLKKSEADLPPLPGNAEIMATLRAKLHAVVERID